MNDFRLKMREANSLALAERFNEAMVFENKLLKVYLEKANEALDALHGLDLTKRDEDGNYINRGQYITLMSIVKEQHAMIEKLSQTAAAREYSLFVKKAAIKIQLEKPEGLEIPDQASFMDDSDEPDFMTLKMKNITPKNIETK